MFRYFLITIVGLSLFCLTGCKEKVVTVEVEKNANKGGLLFKIDKVNAPKNVILVEAVLSRTDFDTVKASLNLITETSADLALNNIPIGTWKLNVNAYDSLQTIVYAGETAVNVQDGITTQVNLTLIPTSTGLGSIYILVHWGTKPPTVWNDYENNPVLSSANFSTPQSSPSQQKIMYDEGKFKMWFDNDRPGYPGNTGYAESYDGFNWRVIKENLFNFENNDSTMNNRWDSKCVIPGAIIKESGIYKMYYVGHNGSSGSWQIGFAQSTDGINWVRNSAPVLSSTATEYQISAGDLVKIYGTYFLYYTFNYNPMTMPPYPSGRGISVATSTDGKTWKRYDGNPILTPSETWEGPRIFYPTVIVENDRFDMMYMDEYATGFGMATSKDGYSWTKTGTKPFFTVADTKGMKTYFVAYPSCRKINNKYFLYYSGASGNNQVANVIRVAVK